MSKRSKESVEEEVEEVVAEEAAARAPKRTPKRWLEEAGHGTWWGNLTGQDKAAIQGFLACGPLSEAEEDLAKVRAVCEERIKVAELRVKNADLCQKGAAAVVAKCEALQRTLDGK